MAPKVRDEYLNVSERLRPFRHVTFYDEATDRWFSLEPSASWKRPQLFVTGRGPGSNVNWYPVPADLLAAFRAGEDWRPVVDWLIEAYPDSLGWVSRVLALSAPDG